MKKFTCYILDDEPLAIKVVEQYLSKIDAITVCGTSTESLEAFREIKQLRPDLLFLDIEMPDLNGLELIEALQHRPQVIVTTAYREYAVESFDLEVLDYLVKPIALSRFLKAVDKFLSFQQQVNPSIQDHILVKANRKTLRIIIDTILYIEGVKDYVKIVLADQQILTKISIGNFLELLPSGKFIRIHKSFAVAKNKITAYTAHDVEVGTLELPLGRVYKEHFLKEMKEGK
jgi:DNA-binding LytR/AlgR family response regulator